MARLKQQVKKGVLMVDTALATLRNGDEHATRSRTYRWLLNRKNRSVERGRKR
jgi:hypothetical protein